MLQIGPAWANTLPNQPGRRCQTRVSNLKSCLHLEAVLLDTYGQAMPSVWLLTRYETYANIAWDLDSCCEALSLETPDMPMTFPNSPHVKDLLKNCGPPKTIKTTLCPWSVPLPAPFRIFPTTSFTSEQRATVAPTRPDMANLWLKIWLFYPAQIANAPRSTLAMLRCADPCSGAGRTCHNWHLSLSTAPIRFNLKPGVRGARFWNPNWPDEVKAFILHSLSKWKKKPPVSSICSIRFIYASCFGF